MTEKEREKCVCVSSMCIQLKVIIRQPKLARVLKSKEFPVQLNANEAKVKNLLGIPRMGNLLEEVETTLSDLHSTHTLYHKLT